LRKGSENEKDENASSAKSTSFFFCRTPAKKRTNTTINFFEVEIHFLGQIPLLPPWGEESGCTGGASGDWGSVRRRKAMSGRSRARPPAPNPALTKLMK